MRFSVNTPGTFPPPTGSAVYSPLITATQRATVTAESGTSLYIISSDSDTLVVTLHQILVSWGELEIAGKLEIRTQDPDPIVIFQSKPSGLLIIPCHDEQRLLGRYGLRAVNNSTGGEYSITVHYTIREH